MSNRLAENSGALLSGSVIDRSKSFTFLLDGHEVPAFAGDTVLSAALAAGIAGAGHHLGSPLALNEQFSPYLIAKGPNDAGSAALNMAYTPVFANAKFECIGAPQHSKLRRTLSTLLGEKRTSAGVDFATTTRGPLHSANPQSASKPTDIVVIGGGIAGMAATVKAGRAGYNVVLIERRPQLGGDALLFGDRDGERRAQESIDALSQELRDLDNVHVLLLCEAVEARSGIILTYSVRVEDDRYTANTHCIATKNTILATGCGDRLPVFKGNRLPGVIGLASSFHLAHAFGAWPGDNTLIAGGSNAIYRMGMVATDAGKKITQIADTRTEPHSRFRDFAKAYGLRISSGTQVRSVDLSSESASLLVKTGLSWDDGAHAGGTEIACDRLVLSEGWLPRLRLWKQLGGEVVWLDERRVLAAGRAPANTFLIGSAAGYAGTNACFESGEQAVGTISRQEMPPVCEDPLPEMFESSDALPTRHVPEGTKHPAYLSWEGLSVLPDSMPDTNKWNAYTKPTLEIMQSVPGDKALCLQETEALVRVGLLGQDDLGNVLSERMIPPFPIPPATPAQRNRLSTPTSAQVPSYLQDRFGAEPKLCMLVMSAPRHVEAGCLIYETSDGSEPNSAIGCILRSDHRCTLALIATDYAHEDTRVSVAEIHGNTAAWISSTDAEY